MTPIRYETRGRCALITIDRPEARNAVSPEVAQGIEAAIDRLESDSEIRVGVLTGTPPVFCAGADLKAINAGRAAELSTERGGFAGLVRRARTKPLIAAVDAPALAGGTELVLSCDLVVASRAAAFGLPEVKRGLIAGAGALFRLPRVLPPAIAMEAVLTGDTLSVEAAARHGLVNRLCEEGEAVNLALALGERIAGNAPEAVRISREVLLATRGLSDEEAWEVNDTANAGVLVSDEVAEGVRAFVEKRAPSWAV